MKPWARAKFSPADILPAPLFHKAFLRPARLRNGRIRPSVAQIPVEEAWERLIFTAMPRNLIKNTPPRTLVLLLLGLASVVKLLWAMNSVGSCDVMLFITFAKRMDAAPMALLYERTTIFNHTPLTGWMAKSLWNATGHDDLHFALILRMGSIVADIALVLGLLRVRALTGRPPWWALCLFAASPVSIMVSGFHGNVDPIMVAFLFYAALAVLTGRPILSGVMFGLACNIKIVPILLAPAFLLYWIGRGRRSAAGFMIASGVLMLAGASYGLIQCPAAFLRNVFGYGSLWGGWGFTYWLRETGAPAFQIMDFSGLSAPQNEVMLALKIILLAGMFLIAWRRRALGGLDFFTTLGAAFTWFFIFTSGAGVQYMVWFAPFLLLLSPRWWLALTAGSTVYLARYYQSGSLTPFPWDFSFPKGPEVPYWAPWTNLVWATFIALLCLRARSWLWPGSISPAVSASPSSQDKPASPALLQAEAVES